MRPTTTLACLSRVQLYPYHPVIELNEKVHDGDGYHAQNDPWQYKDLFDSRCRKFIEIVLKENLYALSVVLTMTTTDENNQLDDIIKPVIETDNSISKTSTSYVKRLIMRPRGVVSK